MAHEIETMAYTNQVPWHGLGHYVEEAPDVKTMLKLAKLNWRVDRRPLFVANEAEGKETHTPGAAIPGFAALTRSSDHKVLDIVGSKYVPVQNEEAFEFFNEFVAAGDAKMETAGSLRGGKYVWGLANLQSSFKLKGNDEVKGYLLVASPHEQGKSMIIKFTTIRVVCNNTLTLALQSASSGSTPEVRIPHRRVFDASVREAAKRALGIAREQMDEFKETANKLKKMTMAKEDVIRAFGHVFQDYIDPKQLVAEFDNLATPRVKQLVDINNRAPGADPNTAWGVLNAVTYYADHVASRTADKRLTNAWFGKGANMKKDMLDFLVAA